MHIQHDVPVLRLHLRKAFVAQDTGVVNQDVNGSKGVQRGFNNALAAFDRRHTIVIGHGFPAQGLDLIDHLISRPPGTLTGTVPRTTQIIDYDFGAAFGQFQGVDAAQAGPGPGNDRHSILKADFCFGNVAVFKNTIVDHHLLGLHVNDFPQRFAFVGLPDDRFDGHSRIQRSFKATFQPPDLFRLPGNEAVNQRAAGVTVGAQAMHDRFFKPGHFGKILVNMELKDIAGKPVDQGLIFSRLPIDHEIRLPLGKFNFFGGSVLSAESAVQARKNGDNTGEQLIPIGMKGVKFGHHQCPFLLTFVVTMRNCTFRG